MDPTLVALALFRSFKFRPQTNASIYYLARCAHHIAHHTTVGFYFSHITNNTRLQKVVTDDLLSIIKY